MNTQELQREEIARLAYQLWEERGCPIGSPELDWDRAEKALMHQSFSDSAEAGSDTASVEGLDVTAQDGGAGIKLDGAKAPRRPRATGRTNEGPRRSTQVR